MLRRFTQSAALRSGIVFAGGGVCFALGNLLFARALVPEDFAVIALVLAIVQIARTLGPVGADTIINRHPVDASRTLLIRVSGTAAATGVVVSLTAWQLYDLAPSVVLLTGWICVGAAINLVGSAFLRSRGMYGAALGLTQGHNAVLFGAAIASNVTGGSALLLPLGLIGGAYLFSIAIGWRAAFRLERQRGSLPEDAFPWAEGRTIIATTIAVLFLLQLERLIIPKLLDTTSLATFAVLAAVAGSPFRVLQMGIGYTLIPELRNAASATDRRRVLRSESFVAGLIVIAASTVVWLITQPFVDWFLVGKYQVSDAMVAAALIAGISKVLASFGSSIVTALSGRSYLGRLRNASWLAVAVALGAASWGASCGLVGVLFGVAAGWVVYAVCALSLGRRVFLETAVDQRLVPDRAGTG